MSATETARMDVGGAVSPPAVECAHCSLPVPAGLVESGADRQFCCAGCRTAFEILHASGMDRYYGLTERRIAPVKPTGRDYAEFDHPKFAELYVQRLPDGMSQVELYLEGVHCASCVWLVERVPLLLPRVQRAELDIRRSLARVVWDGDAIPLSRIGRMLDTLGYAPHPFRGARRDQLRKLEDRAMLARIGVAGAIAVNVMLAALALYSGAVDGMERDYERFFRWVSLALTTPAMIWPARVFFTGAWAALRTRTLNMDVPIAVGLAAGFARGAMNTIQDSGPVYFDGLATLIFALLLGRYLQQRGLRAAADGAELLYSLTPRTARVVGPDGEHEIPSEAVVPGMLLDVRAGETFAADGVVDDGHSRIDTALLTGESRPVQACTGDTVYAGTVNLSAPLRVRVEHSGEASRVARMLRQVEESARRRAPIELQANRVAGWFVFVVLLLAVATFVVWQLVDPTQAADNAIALLIVTCPCALALSTPLAVSMAISRAARAGIFVKGGDALERLSHAGTMLLDKTGTITEGRTALLAWRGPEWVKPLVLALERGSSHPIADGFRRAWTGMTAASVTSSDHVAGGGVVGVVDDHVVVVGSPRFVCERIGVAPVEPREMEREAATPVLVAVDGHVIADAAFGDAVRPDAALAVRQLKARGWTVELLSGDDPRVVSQVGRDIGVAVTTGGASPEDKLRRVTSEMASARGAPVVMVGDGINDAAAITAATVGIGVHGGAEACLSSASVYLTRDGLAPVVDVVDGARRTMRVIQRNFAFAIAYNLVGAGLAIAGVLTPLIAAILMPASSLTVVLASWRGRTFQEPAS